MHFSVLRPQKWPITQNLKNPKIRFENRNKPKSAAFLETIESTRARAPPLNWYRLLYPRKLISDTWPNKTRTEAVTA